MSQTTEQAAADRIAQAEANAWEKVVVKVAAHEAARLLNGPPIPPEKMPQFSQTVFNLLQEDSIKQASQQTKAASVYDLGLDIQADMQKDAHVRQAALDVVASQEFADIFG